MLLQGGLGMNVSRDLNQQGYGIRSIHEQDLMQVKRLLPPKKSP